MSGVGACAEGGAAGRIEVCYGMLSYVSDRAQDVSFRAFAGRCLSALQAMVNKAGPRADADYCAACTRQLTQMLAVLMAARQAPDDRTARTAVGRAADAIRDAAAGGSNGFRRFSAALRDCARSTGLGIFSRVRGGCSDADAFETAAAALLRPAPDAPIQDIYFESMPLSWLGRAYQHMLSFRPDECGILRQDGSARKSRGVYFTPASLVEHVVESVILPLVRPEGPGRRRTRSTRSRPVRLLDPAMGGGDFLSAAVQLLQSIHEQASREQPGRRARLASECVFGVDLDPTSVEIARFAVWGSSGYADGLSESLNSHLLCADALADDPPFDWRAAFPEAYAGTGPPGFDAVVGNPPYVASKNGLPTRTSRSRGQSDLYVMFLETAIDSDLVREGGMLSMVLPDPMLARENAASIRCRLISEWDLVSLLHIYGAFPGVNVANIVPVCRRSPSQSETFLAARIERVPDRRAFAQRPRTTTLALAERVRKTVISAQERCEFLYLLEHGAFGDMVRRIHGPRVVLTNYEPPYAPLEALNIKAIYRGEEMGKAAIDSDVGELPILLGGQSVKPFEIRHEGRRIERGAIRKNVDRYLRTKVLIQKSSARVVAALDQVSRRHPGYVFPQSVYAVELLQPGMHELYLLCLLNSQVMNEYIWRRVTGYKLLQPQLEIEDIRALPIRRVSFTTPAADREADAQRAVRIFEDESLRAGGDAPFPGLAGFVTECLAGSPERSDVVHDVLVYLGRLVMDLIRLQRASPDTETTRRLEAARSAIETVVWRLYTTQPAQLELQW